MRLIDGGIRCDDAALSTGAGGKSATPPDPQTGAQVTRVKERIEFLVTELEKKKEKIIVPTPALSELLVRAGAAGPAYLEILNKSAAFKIVDFDQRAAVEVAAATREAIDAGDKKGGAAGSWAKVKFDRQIIAIAKVEGASTIYSDDGDIARFAKSCGIAVFRVGDLPLPPEDAQQSLEFDDPDQSPEHGTC
jgi:predicted nucleic acid-binding protein